MLWLRGFQGVFSGRLERGLLIRVYLSLGSIVGVFVTCSTDSILSHTTFVSLKQLTFAADCDPLDSLNGFTPLRTYSGKTDIAGSDNNAAGAVSISNGKAVSTNFGFMMIQKQAPFSGGSGDRVVELDVTIPASLTQFFEIGVGIGAVDLTGAKNTVAFSFKGDVNRKYPKQIPEVLVNAAGFDSETKTKALADYLGKQIHIRVDMARSTGKMSLVLSAGGKTESHYLGICKECFNDSKYGTNMAISVKGGPGITIDNICTSKKANNGGLSGEFLLSVVDAVRRWMGWKPKEEPELFKNPYTRLIIQAEIDKAEAAAKKKKEQEQETATTTTTESTSTSSHEEL